MKEPVAYAAVADDGSEAVYVASLREQAEAACREYGWNLVPLYSGPHTWQEEAIAVEEAFLRSGVKRTQPDDEPDMIIPMVNAMADEITRLKKRFALSGNAENVDWTDIAGTGRAYADNLVGEPGISELMHKMADEIELLRGYRDEAESDASIAHLLVDKLKLTAAEREAIEGCIRDDEAATAYDRADILRGLLERLGGKK